MTDLGINFEPPDITFDRVVQEIKNRKDKPEYPTGLADLDDKIWGIWPRELMIVAGRPSHGKTSLTSFMAWNLAKQGKPSMYVTLEMSKEQLVERMFCSEMKVHGMNLRRGTFPSDFEEKRVNFKRQLQDSPIMIVDGVGYRFDEIRDMAMQMGPKIMFIDHVQMIRSGSQKKHEAISEYVRELKQIATTQGIGIVLSSQFNRAGSDSMSLEFLKGSGELEESSDTVLGCYWHAKDEKCMDPSLYDITILKQRHGPTGKVEVNFEGQYYRFTNRYNQEVGR